MDQSKQECLKHFKTLLEGVKYGDVVARADYYIEPQKGDKNNSISFRTIPDEVVDGILKVRDTGETNMFDIKAVQFVADRLGEFNLVNFLEDKSNLRAYGDFITSGTKDITLTSCATFTFYGTEKFRTDMKHKLFPDKK